MTGNYADNTVSVLLHSISHVTAPLGFAMTAFATGGSAFAVAIADIDVDGAIDAATANHSTANASVLLGDGAGGLSANTDYATGSGADGVAIADLDLTAAPTSR